MHKEVSTWLTLSSAHVEQLYAHYVLLTRWNEKLSLTSIEAGPEIVVRHFCESLFFSASLPDTREAGSLADLGSGAGFPGLPFAIVRPNWRITLIESNHRKAVFLREASRGLSNVSVLPQRGNEIEAHFDWLVSRGVHMSTVLSLVPSISSKIGLLIGSDSMAALNDAPSIAWAPPVRLPWGDRRFCMFGEFHVERST